MEGGLEAHKPMLSIVIPAYNEEEIITNTLLEIHNEMNSHFPSGFEIIVIDDGSTDDTFNKATEIAQRLPNIRVFRLPKNSGKGIALLQGFRAAKGDVLISIDADLEFHPKNIRTYFKYMETLNADVVISSKRHPLSKIKYPVFRRIASFYYNMFVRVLFGLDLHDTQAGFKLVRRNVFETIHKRLCVKRFAFDLEFLVAARQYGFKIVEAPINLQFKRFSNRIGVRNIFRIFQDTCAIFYRLYLKKHYIDIPSYGLVLLLKSFFPQTAKRLRREVVTLFNSGLIPLKTDQYTAKLVEAIYERATLHPPMVSVIIPTENNSNLLQDCLESLQKLDYPENLLEILVITDLNGDMDDPNGNGIVSSSTLKYPVSVFQMDGTPSSKRNYGIRMAKGSIIAFTDCDCIVPSQWISKAVKHFTDPSVAAVGGPNLTHPKNNWRQRCSGNILSSKLGTGPMRARYTPVGETRTSSGLELILCNMCVRKSILEMLQGFNEQLFPNEENEFLYRIRKHDWTNNLKIIYDPTLHVYHHRRPLILQHCQQIFNYGVGRGKMMQLHPSTVFSWTPLLVVFAFLAISFPFLLTNRLITLLCSWWPYIPFCPQIMRFLSTLFILYFAGTIAYGVKWAVQQKRIQLLFTTPIALFLTHFAYGCGVMKGLLSQKIKENAYVE